MVASCRRGRIRRHRRRHDDEVDVADQGVRGFEGREVVPFCDSDFVHDRWGDPGTRQCPAGGATVSTVRLGSGSTGVTEKRSLGRGEGVRSAAGSVNHLDEVAGPFCRQWSWQTCFLEFFDVFVTRIPSAAAEVGVSGEARVVQGGFPHVPTRAAALLLADLAELACCSAGPRA